MKLFIYKLTISIFFLYILFEFTIGQRIDYYTDKLENLNNHQKRIEFKEKLLIEIEKGTKKENYFSETERLVLSNFINKIIKELKIGNN